MSSQKTKLAVGLFLVGGTAVALVALIWLGVTRYFEKGYLYVTYFDESVQGLDKASPVKYRGVTVGRVESINVAPDSKLIKVVLKVEPGMELGPRIVAQLRNVGITGSMFVELDQRKEGEPDQSPPLAFPSEFPIVASKPAEISELLRGLDDVLSKIRGLDLEGVVGKIQMTLDLIAQVFRQANVEEISGKLNRSFDEINRLVNRERWDDILGALRRTIEAADSTFAAAEKTFARADSVFVEKGVEIRKALEDFQEATRSANALLVKASSLVGGAEDTVSLMRGHLVLTARNLERASGDLKRMMELLAEQPSQLLFGEPPPGREVKQ